MSLNSTLSIDDICNELQVSSATVRNWIKVGELTLIQNGFVSKESFNKFKKNIVGQTKLNKRANKLQKLSKNTNDLKSKLLDDLNTGKIDPEQAGKIYQNLLTDAEKNQYGIYYTPKHIIDDMLKNVDDNKNKTFCDPCCGSGSFLIKALELGFDPKCIYGFDTDPIAVNIAQKRFEKITGLSAKSQIQCIDFLEYSLKNTQIYYDYIYTNPPWGQKIKKSDKEKLAHQFNLKTDIANDICSLFLAICLKHLPPQGKLGFLMPDAVFNIASYEPLRNLILNNSVIRFCDYGKPFKGLQAGAVLIEIDKNYQDTAIICQNILDTYKREKTSFQDNPKNIINIHCSPDENRIIEYIYNIPHALLNSNIEWGLGIVTGNNTKHIMKEFSDELIAVYKGSDIHPTHLAKPTSFIKKDFSLYQQVAPLHLYEAKEKLIYRFISSKLVFYYDDKQNYILNSANMIVPTDNFTFSLKLLADILNSDFINWLFKKIFNTHKILRSDLEKLPLHIHLIDDDKFCEENYLKNLGIERRNNGTYRIKK